MTELIYILITWRITSLIANEDGPKDFFAIARLMLKIDCFWCISVWVGLAIGYFTGNIIHGLAYSAGAILFEQVICVLDAEKDRN